ncbi:UAA transporter [Zychaea mexicana]|uniref:UAA transporter n=1 Tax=Zychaea mexicana TaxID=64656 RepID=UPI0022FE637F|nr:UAA transporter [Zychaea mexicana]KAI9495005.1 UAA transporter [Zychaea mexicana]
MTSDSSPNFVGSLARIVAPEFPLILSLIFGGCCRQLVTFGQFAFVALEGLRHHLEWSRYGPRLKPTVVPLSRWLLLVSIFFVVSVLNNLALGYRISMPLHIIFRSGGLFANMVMGAVILGKRYPKGQVIGVGLVTMGVVWATLDNANPSAKGGEDQADTGEFLIGITILVIGMILSAGMGLIQEVTYKKYGKQWREGLFYTHFLALPMFVFFYKDLMENVAVYNASPAAPLPVVFKQVPVLGQILSTLLPEPIRSVLDTIVVPKLWAFLALNVLTQYVCIAGVNRMTAAASSLTLNLVLNLRKFTSLLISIFYFDNDFGVGAQMGTGLVILGTIVYTHAGITSSRKPKETVSIDQKKQQQQSPAATATTDGDKKTN